jgi:predicted amidohydrolase YtcJ
MLIIHSAKIYTFDPDKRYASAVAIDGGKIIATGTDDEIVGAFPASQVIDANDHTLIPGLTDSHIHLEEYALSLQKIDCETSSRHACLERVSARAVNSAPGEWILGHGWNQNIWPEGFGNASLLDEISPHNPVYLTHKSLHCAWSNSAALQLAGITRETPDPDGGRISRLPSGDPDGILFESATLLVEKFLPLPSIGQATKSIKQAIPMLWRMGLTGVHDFDGQRCFSALQELGLQKNLNLRVVKSIHLEDLPHAVEIGLRSGFGDNMLQIGWLKLFSDGALGPHTAAMLDPYNNDPLNCGMLMMDAEEIFEHGRLAMEHGISLAVHAIGDRANRQVLDGYAKLNAYEAAHPSGLTRQLHHRIEHVQVIHPDDLPRFHKLNIIASMQPIHATSDMAMADRFWGKRAQFAYAWHSLLSNQAMLVFGSDAPVESPDPFLGLHAAVTRQRADGTPSKSGWYPEQRLSVERAISAYTVTPPISAGQGNRLGKISPGYLADLIVLNENPFTCPPENLKSIHSIATMIDGEWVFSELE